MEAFRDHVLASTGVAMTMSVDTAADGDGALVFGLEVDFERGDWDWFCTPAPSSFRGAGQGADGGQSPLPLAGACSMRLVVENASVPIITVSDNLRMVKPRHDPLFNRARSAPLAVAVLEVTFQAARFLVGERSMDGRTNLTRLEQALDVKVVSRNVFGILRRFQITPQTMSTEHNCTESQIKSVLEARNVLLQAIAKYA
eukprot:SM004792S16805  [mRNA]  locus=s4792:320:1097:+ [translate_table: standard]